MKKQFLTRLWLGVIVGLVSVLALGGSVSAQEGEGTDLFPLAEVGPYAVGVRLMRLTDASRGDRLIDIAIWYPAIEPEEREPQQRMLGEPEDWGWLRATPDAADAPYPMIISSHYFGGGYLDRRDFDVRLASHGYVVIGLNHPDDVAQAAFVNRPLDIRFVVDQFAGMTDDDVADVMDTNNVGVIGESFGAYTALQMTGARIDAALASEVENHNGTLITMPDWNWDALDAYRAEQVDGAMDGTLWPSLGDPRIHAAVMISPCWANMFGDEGLATATVPALIVAGVMDTSLDCLYEANDVYLFDQLGSENVYMLSLTREGHIAGMEGGALPVTTQLVTAFFGTYLQGQEDDAQSLTAEFVESAEAELHLGLAWGVYEGE